MIEHSLNFASNKNMDKTQKIKVKGFLQYIVDLFSTTNMIEKKYSEENYSFKKFLFYSIFMILFTFANLVIYNAKSKTIINEINGMTSTYNNITVTAFANIGLTIKSPDELNKSLNRILTINFTNFLILLLLLFVFIYLEYRSKVKVHCIYNLISLLNSFNNHFQISILFQFVFIEYPRFNLSFFYCYLHSLIILSYCILIDCNHIIYVLGLTVYYLLSNYFILLSVGTEFTQNLNLVVLIFIILHSIYLVYYINKSKYEHYLLDVKLKDDLNKSKNLIDNLNLGIVVFDLNKADTEYNEQYIQKILIDKSFTNQKAKELYLKISIFADLEIYDNEVTMELKRIITDKNINIGIMLNKISEYEGNLNINNTINNTDETQQIILNDDGIFKELENTINDFIKELSSNVKFNDFKFLGTRRNEKILNVYIRKNNINGSLELLISDISSTIKYEEIKNKNI